MFLENYLYCYFMANDLDFSQKIGSKFPNHPGFQ